MKRFFEPTDASFDAAAKYSESARGDAVLVRKGGKLVFEKYRAGFSATDAHVLASGTKSFWGVTAAAAAQDSLLSLDELACATLTEWKDDPRKSKITIRHLLTLSSGIDGGQIGRVPSYADAIAKPASFEPGTHFAYGPVPYQIFGEVLKRKLAGKKQSPLDYLKARVLDPIGLRIASWRGDRGEPHLPSGASLTAAEWAKFGELIRQKGEFAGKRVVDPIRLAECFAPSKANASYGITFWLNTKMTSAQLSSVADGSGGARRALRRALPGQSSGRICDAAGDNMVMAAGAGKQRLYILPEHALVVVRFGSSEMSFSDDTFLKCLLGAGETKPAPPTRGGAGLFRRAR